MFFYYLVKIDHLIYHQGKKRDRHHDLNNTLKIALESPPKNNNKKPTVNVRQQCATFLPMRNPLLIVLPMHILYGQNL